MLLGGHIEETNMIDHLGCLKQSRIRDFNYYAVKELNTGIFYHFSNEEAAKAFSIELERASYVG